MQKPNTANCQEVHQSSRNRAITTTDEVVSHLPMIYKIVASHLIKTGEIKIVAELPASSAEVSP
jgi:hypothetical protein